MGLKLSPMMERLTGWTTYGHWSVDMFIVLSGYCLMIPVAQAENKQLRGGLVDYFKRRSKRILPPYYAALVVSLLLIYLVPGMYQNGQPSNYSALPAFNTDIIAAHLFLVHNFNVKWEWHIDPPLWSVATEWQIYFLFPAVLLPIWRRLNIIAMLCSAFAISVAIHFLFRRFDEACPWFIGLFALGMTGAWIGHSKSANAAMTRSRSNWGWFSAGIFMLVVTLSLLRPLWSTSHLWLIDPVVGVVAVSLILHCVQSLSSASRLSPILQLLESRIAFALGRFSYSIYLIHFPMLALFYAGLAKLQLTAEMQALIMICLGLPFALITSYLFHLAVERPFMTSKLPLFQVYDFRKSR